MSHSPRDSALWAVGAGVRVSVEGGRAERGEFTLYRVILNELEHAVNIVLSG